jgi:hypothetical protein
VNNQPTICLPNNLIEAGFKEGIMFNTYVMFTFIIGGIILIALMFVFIVWYKFKNDHWYKIKDD